MRKCSLAIALLVLAAPLAAWCDGASSLVTGPIVADETMGAASYDAIVRHVREASRLLAGEMSPDDEKRFDAYWQRILDFPSPAIQDWLRAAAPILTEMLRLTDVIRVEAYAHDNARAEATLAYRLGNEQAAAVEYHKAFNAAKTLKAVSDRLVELQAQLEALGPLPDPEEEREAAKARHRASLETVKELLGNAATNNGDRATYYVLKEVRPSNYEDCIDGSSTLETANPWGKAMVQDSLDRWLGDTLYETYEERVEKLHEIHLAALSAEERAKQKYEMWRPKIELSSFAFRRGAFFTDAVLGVKIGYLDHDKAYHLLDEVCYEAKVEWQPPPSVIRVGYGSSDNAAEYADWREKHAAELALVSAMPEGDPKYAALLKLWFADPVVKNLAQPEIVGSKQSIFDIICKYGDKAKPDLSGLSPEMQAEMLRDYDPRSICRDIDDLDVYDQALYTPEEGDNVFTIEGLCDFKTKRNGLGLVPGLTELVASATPILRKGDWVRYRKALSPESESPDAELFGNHSHTLNERSHAPSGYSSFSLRIDEEGVDMGQPYTGTGDHTDENGEFDSRHGARGAGETKWELENRLIDWRVRVRVAPSSVKADKYSREPCTVFMTGATFVYGLVEMTGEEAEEMRAELDAKFHNIAADHEVLSESGDMKSAEKAFASMKEDVEELPSNEEVAEAAEAAAALTKENEERIAYHREIIEFERETIKRLEAELAAEKDEARRGELQLRLVCAKSNIVGEEDAIKSEETGVVVHSRTPFDDLCYQQNFESSIRSAEDSFRRKTLREATETMLFSLPLDARCGGLEKEWDRLVTTDTFNTDGWHRLALAAQAACRAENYIQRLPWNEREPSRRQVARLTGEDALDPEKYKKIRNAAWNKNQAMEEQYRASLQQQVAERELFWVQGTAQVSLFALSVIASGGTSALGVTAATASSIKTAVTVGSMAYTVMDGYTDDGVKGVGKNLVRAVSRPIDVVWSTYDGYKTGGTWGAVLNGSLSVGMNYGMPVLIGKMWGGGAATPTVGGGKASGAMVTKKAANGKSYQMPQGEVAKYEADLAAARDKISGYIAAQNDFNTMELEKMTDAQLVGKINALTRATAKVNADPLAKGILKYEPAYGKIAGAFSERIDRVYNVVLQSYNAKMAAKGFSDVALTSFRNASSKGSVGMDLDLGIKNETKGMVITQNGQRISKAKFVAEAQKTYNEAYQAYTGQDADASFVNITYSGHPEAYRNTEILKVKKDGSNMAEIMAKLSASDARQVADVTIYKTNEMLANKNFPRLQNLKEASRGLAKDMETKLLPALDAKIKQLKTLEASLTRQGKSLGKSDAHNLNRLAAARAQFEKAQKKLANIGEGRTPPGRWDAEIDELTGGQGLSQYVSDMGDMFHSLFLNGK